MQSADPPGPPLAAERWLRTPELEVLFGVSDRAARKALSAAFEQGKPWRGAALVVRQVNARGGAAGQVFEVRADTLPALVSGPAAPGPSLPAPLAERPGAGAPADAPHVADPSRDVRVATIDQHRRQIVGPAMAQPKNSPGRAGLLRQAAGLVHTNPTTGSLESYSARTLRGWIKEIESTGAAKPKVRKAPRTRVLISRDWDRTCPLPGDTKRAISCALEEHIRGLWRANVHGPRHVSTLAAAWLRERCQVEGWKDATLHVCAVPRAFTNRPEILSARELGMKELDATRFFGLRRPRIKRSREGLMPGQIICTDVHPVDVYVLRADGTKATPRMIGWLDLATNHLFYTLHLYDAGKSVTQADVCQSFIAAVEYFGFPQYLQRDNGSENSYSRMEGAIEEICVLAGNLRCAVIDAWHEDSDDTDAAPAARQSPLITALPYRPTSKPIEGVFGIVEGYFASISGHIGGDRMNKKTDRHGREPTTHRGTWESLQEDIRHAVDLYNLTPQDGHLAGRSPVGMRHWLASNAAGDAYLPPTVKRHVLTFAMCETRSAKVHSSGVEVNREWYWHDHMVKPGVMGREVTIRAAKWEPGCVWMKTDHSDGKFIRVDRVRPFHYLDPAGAKEQARRQRLQDVELSEVAKRSPKLNMSDELRRAAMAHGPIPSPVKGATVALTAELEDVERQGDVPPQLEQPLPPALAIPVEPTGPALPARPSRFAVAKAEREAREAQQRAEQEVRGREALARALGKT